MNRTITLGRFFEDRTWPQGPERRALVLLTAYGIVGMGGVAALGTALGSALFLSGVPASAVPLLFVLPVVGVALTFSLYGDLSRRVSPATMGMASMVVLAAAAVGIRVALARSGPDALLALGGLFLLVTTAGRMAYVQFQVFFSQHLGRYRRRGYVEIVALAALAASVPAGLLVEAAVRSVGPYDALWLFVASLLGCAALAWALGRHGTGTRDGRTKGPTRGLGAAETARSASDRRLVIQLAALAALAALLVSVPAFRFYEGVQAFYRGDDVALGVFYGRFALWTGLAAVAVQLVTPALIRRLGALDTLLLFPAGTALALLGTMGWPQAILPLAVLRGADPVLRGTTTDSALSVLYAPLSARFEAGARARFEWIYALSAAAFGLAMLVLWDRLPSNWWIVGTALVVVAWIPLVQRLRRSHADVLREASMQDAGAATTRARRLRRADVGALRSQLGSDDPARVAHALAIARSVPLQQWREALPSLLAHPSPEIRAEALSIVAEAREHRALEAVRGSLDDPAAEVRASALRALGRLLASPSSRPGDREALRRALEAATPGERRAAIAALLDGGDFEDLIVAVARLRAWLEDDDPSARIAGVELLGRLRIGSVRRTLTRAFDDRDLEVQGAAVDAATALADPAFAPLLIERLAHPLLARRAAAALEATGPAAASDLRRALADASTAAEVRAALPEVLARVVGAAAVDDLEPLLRDDDERLRSAAIRAMRSLERSGRRGRAADLDPRIRAETRSAYLAWLDVRGARRAGCGPLLLEALTRRAEHAATRVFDLVAMRYPAVAAADAAAHRARAATGTSRPVVPLTAEQIELLDTMLHGGDRTLILPLFDDDPDRRDAFARRRFAASLPGLDHVLRTALASADPWLRASAVFEVGERRLLAYEGAARAALGSDVSWLREAGLRACARTLRTSQARAVLAPYASDDPDPRVRAYARELLPSGPT